MPTLHVILERGLSGHEACLELDGREIFNASALPSDMMRGFSAQVDVPLEGQAPSLSAGPAKEGSTEAPPVTPPEGNAPGPPPPGAGGSHLVVRLPREGVQLDLLLPPSDGDLWVAVSLTPGGLVSEVGHEPRGYM